MTNSARIFTGLFFLIAFSFAVPSSTFAQTGDPVVDYYVPVTYYPYRAGSTTSPSNLQPSNYGTLGFQLIGCAYASAPSWEDKCPSDLTFTPNAHTGGYQAYGVGVKNWPAETRTITDCGWEDTWVWDEKSHEWVIEWIYVCHGETYTIPAEAGGYAVGRIKWGTTQFPWSIAGPPYHTLSTLAFKGSSFPPCNAVLAPDGETAPCTGTGTYVAGAGYEDKLLIPDNCSLTQRTGTSADQNAGCFLGGSWVSDLPSPYLDTTATDAPAYFVASVGTPNAASLQAGVTYTWRMGFRQRGNESVHGQVRHQGSITKKFMNAAFCTLFSGTFGVNPSCYFNVDQVLLAPPDSLL